MRVSWLCGLSAGLDEATLKTILGRTATIPEIREAVTAVALLNEEVTLDVILMDLHNDLERVQPVFIDGCKPRRHLQQKGRGRPRC